VQIVFACRFLAPETFSGKWSLKADTWAAGVMCFQLLTGRMPFNDKRNPHNAALTAVLRSIMTDALNFDKSYWQDISDDAKDFVKQLLDRDVDTRLSAVDALRHPWLAGDVADRAKGRPLSLNVVQRIQRFGRSDMLNRSLLELMALELAEEDRTQVRAPRPACLRWHMHLQVDGAVAHCLALPVAETAQTLSDTPRHCACRGAKCQRWYFSPVISESISESGREGLDACALCTGPEWPRLGKTVLGDALHSHL
jgi:Protein kinase domain